MFHGRLRGEGRVVRPREARVVELALPRRKDKFIPSFGSERDSGPYLIGSKISPLRVQQTQNEVAEHGTTKQFIPKC